MCGICGQIGGTLLEERLLAAMRKMAHRGPDQQGKWCQNNSMLGHRRLSILDLSDDGRQPLSNEDGTIWLVFNGEIYNFAELRTALEPQHYFQSRTDSEVLVHGYEQWGIHGLLARIRGMFAFGLWDEPQGILYMARDHVGKKPLYYSTSSGSLCFASTVPALLALLGTTPTVSREAIIEYFTYMHIPAPRSIFEGVFKLPPAHYLEFRLGQEPQVRRYWRPDFSQKEVLSEAEWLERIDTVLREAVRDRLVSDVPLGMLLSGGVDSSLVVALMTEFSGRPVTTISMGFQEQGFNELPYARRVAELCGSEHYEHVLHPDAAAVLPDLIFHYGEPFADHSALPTYYLAKAAREHVTVVLTGDGGDENFAGYHTAAAMALASYTLRHSPGVLRDGLAQVLRALEVRGVKAAHKLRWVAELARANRGGYVFDPLGDRTFRSRDAGLYGPTLADQALLGKRDRLYHSLWHEAGETDWVDRALYVDMLAYLPGHLLVKMDVATMAHGLEARAPLLDVRVIELASRIPPQLKLRHLRTKYLLRKLAERYLPHDVLYRRKQGFSLPTSAWLRTDLGAILAPILLSAAARRRAYFRPEAVARLITEHRQGSADHGQRLWLLLMFELWCRMFVDGDLAPGDDLFAVVPEVRQTVGMS